MTFPTGSVSTDHLDGATDSPASARSDLLDAVQKLNDIISSYDSASGIAPLDGTGKVSNTNLPSTLTTTSCNLILDPNSDVVKIQNILELTSQTTAQLNALTGVEGQVAYCSDGDGGNKCLAVYNGTNWVRVTFGIAIST